MASTTFQIFVLSVLASALIEEFGLSRFELGLIGSLNTAAGALTAPWTGRVTDRIGARQSTILAQAICAVGFALMAIADSTLMLIISSLVFGVPQGWSNPATNSLIAERVPAGSRGVVTGIKQSGVQFGLMLAGATLPAMSSAFGWRGAMWVYAAVFAGFSAVPLLLPAKPQQSQVFSPARVSAKGSETSSGPSLNDASQSATPYDMRAVWLISLYAFLMGTSGGAIGRFLALFAEEEVGMSNATAGLVLAVSGLSGIVARIAAGRIAEHHVAPLALLAHIAAIGSFVSLLLSVTLRTGPWLLWPIALLYAVGYAAWNAVAMLAIIVGVDQSQAGRASGAVMFGFLGGLAIGSPIAGLVIDATGSYQPVWAASLVLALASIATARFAQRQT